MLSHFKKQQTFRQRGKELFRIEALSDAIFAFSVSLLVASLEVPQTFSELKIVAKAAIPFFLTLSLLFLFWYQQYVFFRRYGLNDLPTILINLAYLAVILFYIYPLKFLFSVFISSWFHVELFEKAATQGHVVLANEEFPQLIILFSIGYFFIWFLLYLLHKRVLGLTKEFALTPYEKLVTQKEARGNLLNAFVGLQLLFLHC